MRNKCLFLIMLLCVPGWAALPLHIPPNGLIPTRPVAKTVACAVISAQGARCSALTVNPNRGLWNVCLGRGNSECTIAINKRTAEISWAGGPAEVVSTEKVAIEIAIAIWTPIYGKKFIEAELPIVAKRLDDVWLVGGTIEDPHVRDGVTAIKIRASNGEVLGMAPFR